MIGKLRKKPHNDEELALDIPRVLLEDIGLTAGSAVQIETIHDGITIKKAMGACVICGDPASAMVYTKYVCDACIDHVKKYK